jgi:hypothetical protein
VRIFARLHAGIVVELIHEQTDIAAEWHPDFLKMCVDVTDVAPPPQVGWVRTAGGKLVPPEPIVLTPTQRAAAAMRTGCAVTSAANPTLSAVYPTTGESWQAMQDEALHITMYQEFSGGQASLVWDTLPAGTVIFTSTAAFLTVARAVANWRAAWRKYALGHVPDEPESGIAIP